MLATKMSSILTLCAANSFSDFATFLLHNQTFEWTIPTDRLRVTALGTNSNGVSLAEDIFFKAFNGLPRAGVTVSVFKLPRDPASGITISTDSPIPHLRE